MLLLATSPGGRGGKGVLDIAIKSFPHQGGAVTGSFSLPRFGQNFDQDLGIKASDLSQQFDQALSTFKAKLGIA